MQYNHLKTFQEQDSCTLGLNIGMQLDSLEEKLKLLEKKLSYMQSKINNLEDALLLGMALNSPSDYRREK